uniref:Uncharacterized protein n=1 Tax=Rhizophora mucronata TaxID=61149 RepID=A0A2P2QP37_RHIMU
MVEEEISKQPTITLYHCSPRIYSYNMLCRFSSMYMKPKTRSFYPQLSFTQSFTN